jgi:hypothetical protein
MTIKSIDDEDKLPISEVIKIVNKKSLEVLRIVDAMGIGRTSIKKDGIYRTYSNGDSIKIAEGNFKRRRLLHKQVQLF